MDSVHLVVDDIEECRRLQDWLEVEHGLQGRVRLRSAAPAEGQMGSLNDVLVVAASGGGVLTVLAASLRTYLSQPSRKGVHVNVSNAAGDELTLDTANADDAERLLRLLLASGAPDEG